MAGNLVVPLKGKTLQRLLSTFADALGLTAKGIRLNAEAEADAKRLLAQGEADAADIHATHEAARRANVDAITEQAAGYLEGFKPKPDQPPNPQGPDWLLHWLNCAQQVSDEDMQAAFAQIMAGEVKKPGSYSKWAVDALLRMSRDDFRNLEQFASCCWDIGAVCWDSSYTLVPHDQVALDRAGLVRFSGLGLVTLTHRTSARCVRVTYFGRVIYLIMPKDDSDLIVGKARLTPTGQELLQLCSGTPKKAYLMDCLEQWKGHGVQAFTSEPEMAAAMQRQGLVASAVPPAL